MDLLHRSTEKNKRAPSSALEDAVGGLTELQEALKCWSSEFWKQAPRPGSHEAKKGMWGGDLDLSLAESTLWTSRPICSGNSKFDVVLA